MLIHYPKEPRPQIIRCAKLIFHFSVAITNLVAIGSASTPNFDWAIGIANQRIPSPADPGTNLAPISVDSQGNSYLLGSFPGSIPLGTNVLMSRGSENMFATKCDRTGNVVWAKRFGGEGYERGTAI